MNDSDRTNRETTQIWSMNRIEAPFLVRPFDYLPAKLAFAVCSSFFRMAGTKVRMEVTL